MHREPPLPLVINEWSLIREASSYSGKTTHRLAAQLSSLYGTHIHLTIGRLAGDSAGCITCVHLTIGRLTGDNAGYITCANTERGHSGGPKYALLSQATLLSVARKNVYLAVITGYLRQSYLGVQHYSCLHFRKLAVR